MSDFENDPDVSVDAWENIADEYAGRCYGIRLDDLGYDEYTNWLDWEPIEWVEYRADKYGLKSMPG